MLFAVYLALNLVAYLLKSPIGSNGTRLWAIAGAPLLWLAANVNRERSRMVVVPLIALAAAVQIGPWVRDAYSSWGNPAARSAYWQPAVQFLRPAPVACSTGSRRSPPPATGTRTTWPTRACRSPAAGTGRTTSPRTPCSTTTT